MRIFSKVLTEESNLGFLVLGSRDVSSPRPPPHRCKEIGTRRFQRAPDLISLKSRWPDMEKRDCGHMDDLLKKLKGSDELSHRVLYVLEGPESGRSTHAEQEPLKMMKPNFCQIPIHYELWGFVDLAAGLVSFDVHSASTRGAPAMGPSHIDSYHAYLWSTSRASR